MEIMKMYTVYSLLDGQRRIIRTGLCYGPAADLVKQMNARYLSGLSREMFGWEREA